MSKLKYSISVLAILGLVIFSMPAYAQTKIAVVDVSSLLSESRAAKSLNEDLKEFRSQMTKKFSEYEQNLKNRESELKAQRSSLSADEYQKRVSEFEQDLAETQKLVRERKGALDEAAKEAMVELRDTILKITADIAKKEGFNVVVSQQSVVIVDKETNITERVMEALNSELTELKLDVK